jgi:hypothetical protein
MRKPDTRSEEQRQRDHAAAKKAFNDLLHDRPNKVQVTRGSTRREVNDALRRAAGWAPSDDDAPEPGTFPWGSLSDDHQRDDGGGEA